MKTVRAALKGAYTHSVYLHKRVGCTKAAESVTVIEVTKMAQCAAVSID